MKPIGIYIHIPYCDGKCAYCNFYSKIASQAEMDEYTSRLIENIELWSATLKRSVDTVYFGGGTPSLLGHDRLIKVLNTVRNAFDVICDAEITVEVNPSSTDELDFSALRKAGFNRLSIGLQSADNHELAILGRRHTVDDVYRTVKRAQNSYFDNISLDVMLAIPEQTRDSLDNTIRFCVSCGVQHISCYILKIEEGTRFWRERVGLSLFSDDEQASIYEYTVNRLDELGFRQYEISNFSRPGFESRHNLHYWHDEEYLGIGPSAHSFLNGERFYYDSDFQKFFRNETTYESSGGDSDEYIMLALRLSEGLIFKNYVDRFHRDISMAFLDAAHRLEKNRLCVVDNESVRLTKKGFLVSNSVIGYLLENT